MRKKPTPPTASDDQVRALLQRYRCPVPIHKVRTRFLDNIASLDMQPSAIKAVEALWGGELPAFDTIDAANALRGALVMGLWNRLTRHQERSAPFRLTRIEVPPRARGWGSSPCCAGKSSRGFRRGAVRREGKP